jgi:putative SOS response-associated peptidase YedK
MALRHDLCLAMTSRFALTTPIETLRLRFGFAGGMPYPPRYRIAPTEPVAVVRLRPGIEASGARELALVRWGLIPHWAKDPGDFATLVTARAETVLEKPSFKIPMRHRRCVVPADAFYQWSGKPKSKVAHMVKARDQSILAIAALWDHWLGRDGSEIDTLALVTVPANGALGGLSERMPALLSPDAGDAWLDVRGTSQDSAARLLQSASADDLEMFRIEPHAVEPTAVDRFLQALPNDPTR